MKNLKISTKLYLILAMPIVASMLLAFIGISNINVLIVQTKTVSETMTAHLNEVISAQGAFDMVSVRVRDIAMNTDPAIISKYQDTVNQSYDTLAKSLDNYATLLKNRNIASGDEYNNVHAIISELPNVKTLSEKVIELALQNDIKGCTDLLNNDFIPMATEITVHFNNLSDINKHQANAVMESADATKDTVLIVIVIVAAVVITILAAFITAIIRSIVRPIDRMVKAATELADGNLNMNIIVDSTDEISKLSIAFSQVVNTIKKLISDMDALALEHDKGNMDARIDASYYKGAYNDVADKVNTLVSGYVVLVEDVIHVSNEFGQGNFRAELKQLPGKKANMNVAMEDLCKNLQGVGNELSRLVNSALEGNLSARSNAKGYKGDWEKLLRNC